MTVTAGAELDCSVNKLILGDNLEILKTFPDECIDLIYLDPPFFSNRNYEVIWGDKGEIRSFEDRWSGKISHYIDWLKERVNEMHRVLKQTGSIFLHCDWHADAYIRVHILDAIFDEKNFRGHIVWERANPKVATKKLTVLTDTIFYYSKSNIFNYNPVYKSLRNEYVSEMYKLEDEKGKYRLVVLTGPGINANDKEWAGYNPASIGRHWATPNEVLKKLVPNDAIKTLTVYDKLNILNEHGYIQFSKNGTPNYKRYFDANSKQLIGNLWNDIKNLQGKDSELIGYPTQKPEALLERIINMASNEGDIVLDPFVGGGTTIAVADKLKRQWIGIDQSVQAVKVAEFRLQKIQNNQPEFVFSPYIVQLHKYDYDTLRYKDAFEFEAWIVRQFGGRSNARQRGDMGLDGKTSDGTPIQVKRSDNIGRNVIDNFKSACERFDKNTFAKNVSEKSPVGYIIAFSFGKGAIEEVARLKTSENIIIKLVTVDEIVHISVKPSVAVHINEVEKLEGSKRKLEFTAHGNSPAGIEFYSWDFSYDIEGKKFNPQILLDKAGRQTTLLQAGTHNIAVKVVDNDGLENVECIKLRINGGVNRE